MNDSRIEGDYSNESSHLSSPYMQRKQRENEFFRDMSINNSKTLLFKQTSGTKKSKESTLLNDSNFIKPLKEDTQSGRLSFVS
jgi:hypothetical protein